MVNYEKQFYTIEDAKIVNKPWTDPAFDYANNNTILNPYPSNYTSNVSATSTKVYKLDATTNINTNKTGLGIVLKVMAGDQVNIFGRSFHQKPAGGYTNSTNSILLSELISAFTGTGVVAGKGITGSQVTGQAGFPTTMNGLIGNQPAQSADRPKAAINWIVFDEQFKWVSGGFDMVGTATNTNGTPKYHDNSTIPTISVPKNGYIYVYCSNESQYNVFFDNLQLVHTRGPVLEETHYYPFGLTMAGISSKALTFGEPGNKRKFNGGTELNSDLDIGLYETRFRGLDPQIGRWSQIDPMADSYKSWSPYVFALNNPVLLNDPSGLASEEPKKETSTPDKPKVLEGVVVTGKRYKNRTIDLISRSPTVMENIVKDVPWSQLTSWSGDKIDKYFRNYVNKHPEHYRYLASKYIDMRWARHGTRIVGAGEIYDAMVNFLDYGLAAAENKVSPLPDPTGISSMIASDLSADLDESILSQALTLAAKGIYNIEGLGRVFNSLSRRGHDVPLTGTYVSSGELLSIFLNGGIVNPNLLTFKNYGFTDTAPSKDGVRYNHFILYNEKTTLPITEK